MHLEVLTTPTCPYCPGAVRIAHRFALASPMIVADMVAAAEFPEVAQRYHAASVPLLVVDGTPVDEEGVTEQRVLDLVLAAARTTNAPACRAYVSFIVIASKGQASTQSPHPMQSEGLTTAGSSRSSLMIAFVRQTVRAGHVGHARHAL